MTGTLDYPLHLIQLLAYFLNSKRGWTLLCRALV